MQMSGPPGKPQGNGDFVEVPASSDRTYVAFKDPGPTDEVRHRPLRLAMLWIFVLVVMGLFWSSFFEESATPHRRVAPVPGTTVM